jgi:hypothetical protein
MDCKKTQLNKCKSCEYKRMLRPEHGRWCYMFGNMWIGCAEFRPISKEEVQRESALHFSLCKG